MHFENSFEVQAEPDNVYKFLLDVTKVVTCVPGAELTEVLEDDTFQGRMKVKVGAIMASYRGTAKILSRDDASRTATLSGQGRETTGAGAATMEAVLSVTPTETGAAVSIGTELTITGRVAQFGRGVIEDVSKRLVGQMADCIKAKIEHERDASEPATAIAADTTTAAPPAAPVSAPPLNLFAVLLSVLRERIGRRFGRGRASGRRA